ncbi:MAG TPA: hypothetical protein PK239_13835, partial [Chitinophagales bacterium]|nr:hypothetical protein [Chitinophagales bacterium]
MFKFNCFCGLLAYLSFFYTVSISAQPDRDAHRDRFWILGYGFEDVDPTGGNMIGDFSEQPLQFATLYTTMNFHEANASVCDTAG